VQSVAFLGRAPHTFSRPTLTPRSPPPQPPLTFVRFHAPLSNTPPAGPPLFSRGPSFSDPFFPPSLLTDLREQELRLTHSQALHRDSSPCPFFFSPPDWTPAFDVFPKNFVVTCRNSLQSQNPPRTSEPSRLVPLPFRSRFFFFSFFLNPVAWHEPLPPGEARPVMTVEKARVVLTFFPSPSHYFFSLTVQGERFVFLVPFDPCIEWRGGVKLFFLYNPFL